MENLLMLYVAQHGLHFKFDSYIYELASLPGRFHLQCFITCSMQIRRGKAWEIWSLHG